MKTDLVPQGGNPIAELERHATMAFRSGLLPRSVDTVEKAIIIALAGRELGLEPMAALSGIYVVNDMFALRGATMLRLIYERVPGAKITVLTPPDKSGDECVVEMQRPNGNAQQFRYTMREAKAAGFANKPIWSLHPTTMLRWAAIRTGARIVFADAIAGCYMEDELEEQAHAKAVEKAATVQAIADAPAPPPEPEVEVLPKTSPGDYVVPHGEWAGQKLRAIDKNALADYAAGKRETARTEKKRIGGQLAELLDAIDFYLAEET